MPWDRPSGTRVVAEKTFPHTQNCLFLEVRKNGYCASKINRRLLPRHNEDILIMNVDPACSFFCVMECAFPETLKKGLIAMRTVACLVALLKASSTHCPATTHNTSDAPGKNLNPDSRESRVLQLPDKARESRKKDNIPPIQPLYGKNKDS